MAINQRLNLWIMANAGQAQAAFGQLGGSVLGVGRSMRATSQQSGLMNSQMRALGTTMKYMFAGTAVYGTLNMVRNLAEVQKQMGLISAIGTSANFKDLGTGAGLQKFQNALLGASTDTITNFNDMNNAAINFLSTVQGSKGVTESSIVPSLEAISKAATLSQTPVEDMTKAITTMNVAFGRLNTTRNIEDFAARWTKMIAMVPGGVAAAPQLVTQMGRLSAMAVYSRTSPGQMLGMLSGVLRFGMPPSQAGQGLSYFLQTLATPQSAGTTKAAREMWASLGITSNQVAQDLGGRGMMLKVFQAMDRLGVRGNLRRAARRAWLTRDDPNTDPNSIRDLGVSGPAIDLASTLFRRQHAVRTLVALYAEYKTGKLFEDMKTLADNEKAHARQVSEFADMWDRLVKQSPLAKAGTALQNMRFQFSKGLEPLVNWTGDAAQGLQKLMLRHPDWVKGISTATFATIAGLGVNKVLGNPLGTIFRAAGLGRFAGIFGKTGSAVWGTKLAEDFAKSAGGIQGLQDGSPERPFYVVVLHDFDKPTGVSNNDPTKPGFWDKFGKRGRDFLTKGAGAKIAGLGVAGAVAAAFDLTAIMAARGDDPKSARIADMRKAMRERLEQDPLRSQFPALAHFFRIDPADLSKRNQQLYALPILKMLGWDPADPKKFTPEHARRAEKLATQMFASSNVMHSAAKAMSDALKNVSGDIELNITIKDSDKTTKGKVHLDPSSFIGGKSPGSRGRKKTYNKTMTHK